MITSAFLSASRMPRVVSCSDWKSAEFDGVVVVTDATSKLTGKLQPLAAVVNDYAKVKLVNTYTLCALVVS